MYRGIPGGRYLSKLVDQEARDQLALLQLALLGSMFASRCEHSSFAAAMSLSTSAICSLVRSPDQLARLQLARDQLARLQLARDQLARSGLIASDQLARLQLARL